jgi:hypothetical protein
MLWFLPTIRATNEEIYTGILQKFQTGKNKGGFGLRPEIFKKEGLDIESLDLERIAEDAKTGLNADPFVIAIRNDDVVALQTLTAADPSFDFNVKVAPYFYDKTRKIGIEDLSSLWEIPLIGLAAYYASVECFKFLLLKDVNLEGTQAFAAASGNREIVRIYEQKGVKFGLVEAVSALLNQRNDIYLWIRKTLADFEPLQPLDRRSFGIASISALVGVVAANNIEALIHLCETTFDPKKTWEYQWPPLYVACWLGRTEAVKILLTLPRISVNMSDFVGPPLIAAVEMGHWEIMEALVNDERCDVMVKNEIGDCPLIIAIKKKDEVCARLLIGKMKSEDIETVRSKLVGESLQLLEQLVQPTELS